LVKLLLEEGDSHVADDLWDASDRTMVSRIAHPEARAALAAAARAGRLTLPEMTQVKNRFHRLWRQLRLIELGKDIAKSAGDLAEQYGLRCYDAVHLSSAMALEDVNLVFVTWDWDLRNAGRESGLRVAPASV
jgi:predicted nucleic acid-binding protein